MFTETSATASWWRGTAAECAQLGVDGQIPAELFYAGDAR